MFIFYVAELLSYRDRNSNTEIYLLDITQDYLAHKKSYHAHPFVSNPQVSTVELGQLHLTLTEYFMPDPLRWFGNREFFSFLGPPDLENDFYRGPSPAPFFRKVEAEYQLYKVESKPF